MDLTVTRGKPKSSQYFLIDLQRLLALQREAADAEVADSRANESMVGDPNRYWYINGNTRRAPAILKHSAVSRTHAAARMFGIGRLVNHEVCPDKKGVCFGSRIHQRDDRGIAVGGGFSRGAHNAGRGVGVLPIDNDGIESPMSHSVDGGSELLANLGLNRESA